MRFERQNPPPPGPGSPRPGSLHITSARVQIYAQNNPAGYAFRCSALAGVLIALLAVTAASPSLADPTGIPGWSLVWIFHAVLVAALATGLFTYTRQKNLPRTGETDPVRYASARLQAASGDIGPDPETNRLARTLHDRFVRASNPGLYAASVFVGIVFCAFLPVADVNGPGFQAENLLRPAPLTCLLVLVLFLYYSVRTQRDRFEAFRATYDRRSGPLT
ncbi:hypothetical protein ACFWTE_28715 [Nocardiopsis sp. NPDC058631]|uniref:hypothetical protein n=1 Tax=Nocardiopsis sp. NPDC058631 TaxID=3346566 RepID=UPI003656519E